MPDFVLILEDDAARAAAFGRFVADLLPACVLRVADRADAMVGLLDAHLGRTVLISLDHDLPLPTAGDDPGTGRDVADWLAARPPVCPVVVHTSNNAAAAGMVRVLRDGGWAPARVYPSPDAGEWVAANWAPVVRRWIAAGLVFAS